MTLDLYRILGVAPESDQRAIEAAYRQLCRRHHPDVCKEADAGSRMRDINAAYQVLKMADRRRDYDRTRARQSANSVQWQAARRVWAQSNRVPNGPPPYAWSDNAHVRTTPGAIDFGFLGPADVATRPLIVRAWGGGQVRARVLTRGDWLAVDRANVDGIDAVVHVTADPRGLAAFWSGLGADSARLDGWIEVVDAHGSMRVPAGAILRRDVSGRGWWNPFARRAS